MNQPQAEYQIADKPYVLQPPNTTADMDKYIHGAVQGVNDALACLGMYIRYLREFKRDLPEIKAAEWFQERLRQIEDSSYWIDLCDTAGKVEERRPF